MKKKINEFFEYFGAETTREKIGLLLEGLGTMFGTAVILFLLWVILWIEYESGTPM